MSDCVSKCMCDECAAIFYAGDGKLFAYLDSLELPKPQKNVIEVTPVQRGEESGIVITSDKVCNLFSTVEIEKIMRQSFPLKPGEGARQFRFAAQTYAMDRILEPDQVEEWLRLDLIVTDLFRDRVDQVVEVVTRHGEYPRVLILMSKLKAETPKFKMSTAAQRSHDKTRAAKKQQKRDRKRNRGK